MILKMNPRVVIIGGGWAGIAAGVELARRGFNVTLLEAGRIFGGRARSPATTPGGMKIDWGQHLFLGGYRQTMKLLDLIGTRRHLKPVLVAAPFYERSGKKGSVYFSSLQFINLVFISKIRVSGFHL